MKYIIKFPLLTYTIHKFADLMVWSYLFLMMIVGVTEGYYSTIFVAIIFALITNTLVDEKHYELKHFYRRYRQIRYDS